MDDIGVIAAKAGTPKLRGPGFRRGDAMLQGQPNV